VVVGNLTASSKCVLRTEKTPPMEPAKLVRFKQNECKFLITPKKGNRSVHSFNLPSKTLPKVEVI